MTPVSALPADTVARFHRLGQVSRWKSPNRQKPASEKKAATGNDKKLAAINPKRRQQRHPAKK